MRNLQDFFKDKQGRIVIFQAPNSPLMGWFIFTLLAWICSAYKPKIYHLFEMLSFGFIFTWAWLEIISGVNYFRRMLGSIVLVLVIWLYM